MKKVNFNEIVNDVTWKSFREAIGLAKPSYKGKGDNELREIFGLTEYQFSHLQKALGTRLGENLQGGINQTLINGDSIEIPHSMNIYVYQSKRKNSEGQEMKKLSIKTRTKMKKQIN